MPEISFFFGAILALLQIPMTVAVGLRRRAVSVLFLDGGDDALTRRIRAHANFTETVPIAVISMAAAEIFGTADSILMVGGATLVLGRLVHYVVVIKTSSGPIRLAAMMLTLLPMAVFSVLALHGYLA